MNPSVKPAEIMTNVSQCSITALKKEFFKWFIL